MGARGGAVRVTAFRCGTCSELFERRDGGRKAAVECCNEKVAAAEEAARAKVTARALSKVPTPTAKIIRRLRTEYAVATTKCPRSGCFHSAKVKVEVRSTWNGNLSRADALKKASALAKAQIGRHLRQRFICGR